MLFTQQCAQSNKRKLMDSPPPPVLASASDSNNSVHLPMSDIESAKHKALEMATRTSVDVDPLKRLKVDNGKGGGMQVKLEARIQGKSLHLPPGDMSKEVTIENQPRNSSIFGPQNNWGPPMQQLNYGYAQPGPNTGQPAQYNMNQPSYPGYPPQPTSGAYATSWDQSSIAPQNPQPGGYQAQTQNNWGPPMQQPNYGYAKPGPNTGQPAQYNMNQPSYPGYPPQPTSGAHATSWDQSSIAPQNPQTGGYQAQPQNNWGPSMQQPNYGYAQPGPNTGQPAPFKNFLQQFAGKNLPVYTLRTEGPAQSLRFKSSVSVHGKSYETAEFFTKLKDAEQATAKLACQELLVDAVLEDGGLHKNLLGELAREKGLMCPKYEYIKSGEAHMPLFVYTVEIGSRKIEGTGARTKKLAELNAARAAYYALMETN